MGLNHSSLVMRNMLNHQLRKAIDNYDKKIIFLAMLAISWINTWLRMMIIWVVVYLSLYLAKM